MSQSRSLKSLEAVKMRVPSGLKETSDTGALCFMGTHKGAPVIASQIRAVRSAPTVAIFIPSELTAAITHRLPMVKFRY